MADARVLVTGALGSIGISLTRILRQAGANVMATDVDTLDVTDADCVERAVLAFMPRVVFHLAGAKHAPDGERDPLGALRVNAIGTANIVAAARIVGAHVVLASTGKAANPETAYGASKLIAERMTLNAGGSVARFYNVCETAGNVFELWQQADSLHVVAECRRFFITRRESVGLLLHAAGAAPGRYMVNAGIAGRLMAHVAADVHPSRIHYPMPPRRGDRVIEPRWAAHEQGSEVAEGILLVTSPHDHEGGDE